MPEVRRRSGAWDDEIAGVKLLFDQNLSRRLVPLLRDVCPEAFHLSSRRLAEVEGAAIVTKDTDFLNRSVLLGHPPKVIWISLGNCSTTAVERVLRVRRDDIARFISDNHLSHLIIA